MATIRLESTKLVESRNELVCPNEIRLRQRNAVVQMGIVLFQVCLVKTVWVHTYIYSGPISITLFWFWYFAVGNEYLVAGLVCSKYTVNL